jgi:integrase
MARGKKATRKLRLTELTVRKARPLTKAYQIWDARQSHLALRVQPTGHRSWMCVYSRRGRSRWLTLGSADVIGLAEARLMAAEAMLKVAKGGDPAADKKAERGAGTFAELHEKYLEQHARKHNRSWPQADALIKHNVLPRWGKLQASSISRTDVKAMMAAIAAPITANQVLAAVSAIFSWGVREELVGTNPCRQVPRNPTKSRERVLSDSEIPLFWQAFDGAGVAGKALKAILLAGQRPGEVAHMRLESIKDGWWEMPGEPVPSLQWPGTKNGQSHRVWLPARARALIELETDHGFAFAGEHGGNVNKLDAVMRDICRQIGAERATPHDLRRTHGTMITGLGFGREAMNRVQNHKEGGIASVYDRHQYSDENRRIMEAVAGKIVSLAEGKGNISNVVTIR